MCWFSIYRSSDGDTKAAEMNKRKLSADLKVTRHHISIKQRDGKTCSIDSVHVCSEVILYKTTTKIIIKKNENTCY